MLAVIGFLTTKGGRWSVIIGSALLVFIVAPNYYRKQGASRVMAQIERKAEILNEKATEAHNAAGKPGAVDRLRQRYCTDC